MRVANKWVLSYLPESLVLNAAQRRVQNSDRSLCSCYRCQEVSLLCDQAKTPLERALIITGLDCRKMHHLILVYTYNSNCSGVASPWTALAGHNILSPDTLGPLLFKNPASPLVLSCIGET